MISLRPGIIGLALACLAGCAAAPDEDAPNVSDAPVGVRGCFYAREVSNFRPIDRSRLIVFAPGDGQAFLVRVSPPSPELRNADRLRFDSRSGRICGYAGESLYFDSRQTLRYAIMDVRRLDELEVAELRAVGQLPAGDIEAEEGASASIEPVDGAEPEIKNDEQEEEAGDP